MTESIVKDLFNKNDDLTLRPQSLDDFIGQEHLVKNLSIFISAAKQRGEPLDHVLLHGPPGLGKTTLAQIIAKEQGSQIKIASGPSIVKSGDLAAILTNLQKFDVLFIDEIHRLPVQVEEILYSAMEDFKLDIIIGEGPAARSIRIDLAPFTLVGATTRSGLLTQPLRERFGIPLRVEFYTPAELAHIIKRASSILNCPIDDKASASLAKRSRGTPRIAGRLLKRVRDFATVLNQNVISSGIVDKTLMHLKITDKGLDPMDMRYLRTIAEFYDGGPVGVETLAAVLSEQKDTIEDAIEPFLMQQGFIKRTPRGRMLTELGYAQVQTVP